MQLAELAPVVLVVGVLVELAAAVLVPAELVLLEVVLEAALVPAELVLLEVVLEAALVPLELVVHALEPLQRVLVGLAVVPVHGFAALVPVLLAVEPHHHTCSALFAAASPHLELDIANLHSLSLCPVPSPSPPAPLLHSSFGCR